jgi:glucose/arabinose dehydrogenase
VRKLLTVAAGASATALAAFSLTAGAAPAPRVDPSGPPAGARAGIGDGAGGFTAGPVAGFDQPVFVTGPKGANHLLFVVEQPGVIRVVRNGKKLQRPFLDIHGLVESGGERGLLSVAFSPHYGRDGLFYVYFTDHNGDIVIREYRRAKGTDTRARKHSGRTVIKVRHRENANHNGGQAAFGPDGFLYFGTGDGGSGGDPPENAQNKDSLLGKLIRINPRRKGKKSYTVPKSNPFSAKRGRREIYSLGLRNPFRFSFDRKRLVIADVGQDQFEEVDYETVKGARGANFGWDAFEGSHRFDSPDASPPPANPVPPIFDYSHSDGGCTVIGGYVSRDKRIPSLYGRYLYGDLCIGQIRSLIPQLSGARDDRNTGLANQAGISSFGQDSRGRNYFTNLSTGKLYAIRPKK